LASLKEQAKNLNEKHREMTLQTRELSQKLARQKAQIAQLNAQKALYKKKLVSERERQKRMTARK
jgi:chromosome segregation ATPase